MKRFRINHLSRSIKSVKPTGAKSLQVLNKRLPMRSNLWISTVELSNCQEQTKRRIKKAIEDYRSKIDGVFPNLFSAHYALVVETESACEQDPDRQESEALFETIRDDVWQLWKIIERKK